MDSAQLRIADIEGGWILAEPDINAAAAGAGTSQWTARNRDGDVRWTRSDLQDAVFACRRDGSCLRGSTAGSVIGATAVTPSNASGQDLAIVSLPANEQLLNMERVEQTDELRVLSRHGDLHAYQLYRVQPGVGTLQLLARSAPLTADSLVSIAHDQLVLTEGADLLRGWGLDTILWSRAVDHDSLLDDSASDLWQLPRDDGRFISGGLGPFTPAGPLHWLVQPAPFVVSRLRHPIQPNGERPAIVGTASGTSWIAGQFDRGRQSVQLAIIDNAGQRQGMIALDDALGPVVALVEHAATETAVIAYPAATASGEPSLRVRQIQHRLFRDGLE